MAVYSYFEWRKRPKIVITPARKNDKLGFSVLVVKNFVKDAIIRCNNITYPWVNDDGSEIEKKHLWSGNVPSFFYPFQVTVEYVELKVGEPVKTSIWIAENCEFEKGSILIRVKEVHTQKKVFEGCYPIPKESSAMALVRSYSKENRFNISIRLVGEGINEARDYNLFTIFGSFIIPIEEGKPITDNVILHFELKRKWFG